MALPIIQTPTVTRTLPLSKKKVQFRAFNVGEERMLLAASMNRKSDPQGFVNNTLQVISNCLKSDLPLDTFSAVDIEFLLLSLRAKSVGETIDVTVEHEGKQVNASIDIDNIFVDNVDRNKKIELTDEVGLIMKELSYTDKIGYSAKYGDQDKQNPQMIFDLIVDMVEAVYDENNKYVVGVDTTKDEVRVFIDGLVGASAGLYEYVQNMPTLKANVTLENGEQLVISANQLDFLK